MALPEIVAPLLATEIRRTCRTATEPPQFLPRIGEHGQSSQRSDLRETNPGPDPLGPAHNAIASYQSQRPELPAKNFVE
jgi:hypothetical protein